MEKVGNIPLFNSPLEAGLRLLCIFKNTNKSVLDVQRLVYYNYLLVHSSDIPNAPESLHPEMPNRSCEIIIGRKIIQRGIYLLLSKGLICVKYSNTGIKYTANSTTSKFLGYFNSKYSKALDNRAQWVCSNFDSMSEKKLNVFMQSNLGKWGAEFSREFSQMGDSNA